MIGVSAMRKILPLLLCLALVLPSLAEGVPSPASDWMVFSSLTEEPYTRVSEAYTYPVYAGPACDTPAAFNVTNGSNASSYVTAPQDGLYEVWLSYRNTDATMLPTEMTVYVDGKLPFYELRRVKLESKWVDDGIFPLDRYGNEIAPMPKAMDTVLEKGLADSAGRTSSPFLFSLKAGEHTFTFAGSEGAARISGISLRAKAQVREYQSGDAPGNSLIVLEGERMDSRNEASIRGAGEFNAALSPYDYNARRINFLDGASFDEAGDSVTYRFTVENTGWYNMGCYYRQSVKADFPVFADILIDGALPSVAARDVPFAYSAGFSLMTVKAGTDAQRFYLEAGVHTLTLTINCELLTPAYEMIDRLLNQINGLSLEIVHLTGGDTTDRYRDYSLSTYIPGIADMLFGWADQCDAMVRSMSGYGSTVKAGLFSSLTVCADQLRRLGKQPEDLPRRLPELSTGANSAARALAQQLQDLAANDLSIDQIYLFQSGAALPAKAGFMESAAAGAARFAASFGAQDYSVGGAVSGHLQVWVGRSRQYAEIIQNMADTQFTPATGIRVDLSIMPDANKLVLSNAAGTAPDVVLSLQYVVPSYLDIRGALLNLTQFEDFGAIAQRFPSGLFVPYTLEGGIYAMPETVNFWVMFYRRDIFSALNIPIPDSMDDVKAILPELQRRNMNFYFPTAGMVGMKVFPGTLPLILQAGGTIYGSTIGNTTLDSEQSLEGFRALTDLFTVYNMPVDVPAPGFYQQFRAGTLPIGIADLSTYNLLLNAAPELDGLWDIALFPGLVQADGSVSRWTTGGAETMGILSASDMPDQSWEFLKWWSSASVQAEFGNTLQSTYGSEYIWPTANMEAFAQLPLQSSHKKTIIGQMQWMTEAPWVLGTYMLERELSNAFISVVVDGTEARRALDTAVKRINRETYRKLEEFGFYSDGKMLRELVTPDISVVKKLITDYRAAHGGEGLK
jgi:ABC-type glycerol-3-phosphate transport system substrate-binding protein